MGWKVSICISVKNRSRMETARGRLQLLPKAIKEINNWKCKYPVEVILADFQSDDWPLEEWIGKVTSNIDCKIVQLGNQPFSRGLGLNKAFEASTGNLIFFSDADILVPANIINFAMRQCVQMEEVMFPICWSGRSWLRWGYGLCLFRRSTFLEIGPWQEWSSYGGEDNEMHQRVQASRFKIWRDEWNDLVHQWHPPKIREHYEKKGDCPDWKEFRKKKR